MNPKKSLKPNKTPKLTLKPTRNEPYLQITMFHEQLEQQNGATSTENKIFELKSAASTVETAALTNSTKMVHMENEKFQFQNVARTVEMAASSSKMLQIARKTGRKTDQKQEKPTNPNAVT